MIKAEFPSIIAGLPAGQVDLAVASQSRPPERARVIAFLNRLYYDGFPLFVPAGSKANRLGALEDAPVAVAQGTVVEKFLRERNSPSIATYRRRKPPAPQFRHWATHLSACSKTPVWRARSR